MKRLPLTLRPLEHSHLCDVCNKPRSTRKHQACAKQRQKHHQEKRENEARNRQ